HRDLAVLGRLRPRAITQHCCRWDARRRFVAQRLGVEGRWILGRLGGTVRRHRLGVDAGDGWWDRVSGRERVLGHGLDARVLSGFSLFVAPFGHAARSVASQTGASIATERGTWVFDPARLTELETLPRRRRLHTRGYAGSRRPRALIPARRVGLACLSRGGMGGRIWQGEL